MGIVWKSVYIVGQNFYVSSFIARFRNLGLIYSSFWDLYLKLSEV